MGDVEFCHHLVETVAVLCKVDRFGKELAPLVTSGPPGVTGFAGGRPKATEVLGFWPALIPKDRVQTEVSVEEVQ